MLIIENCFQNVKKIRETVYDITISAIYYKIILVFMLINGRMTNVCYFKV